MANGIDRRAQIDQDTVKALLLINGGGAVALLTLLPDILDKEEFRPLAHGILVGITLLVMGLVLAIVHNRLRRVCSLVYENHNMRPPKGRFLGMTLPEPGVCFTSHFCMWASIAAFVLAGGYVSFNGIRTLGAEKPKQEQISPSVTLAVPTQKPDLGTSANQ